MKKIRFSQDEGTAFYKDLHQQVNEYFRNEEIAKHGNNVMWFKIVLYFGLDILFFVLMLQSNTLAEFYIYYLLMGFAVLLTAFNISHDAAHGVAVKSKFWNKVLFSFSFNLQGNNAYVWGKNHNESHHLYTNIEGSDIDVLNNPLIRMTHNQPLKWFHKFQFLYAPILTLFYSLNWFLFRETLMIFGLSSRTIQIHIPRPEVIKLFLYKVFYVGYMILLPYFLLDFGIGHILLAFLLNHFLVSIIFVGVLGVSHLSDFVHHPEPDDQGKLDMSWAKLQMLTSVDYNAESNFFNWTLGGFNAHALHHLLPHISHVHYLKILPIFKATAEKHGITYMNMPYRKALSAYFRFLYKMGQHQNFKPLNYESQTS